MLSDSCMEQDGFVLVSRRKKSGKSHKVAEIVEPVNALNLSPVVTSLTRDDLSKVTQRIIEYKRDLVLQKFWAAVVDHLQILSSYESIREIICYGLGSLLHGPTTYASRQQLALLLALKDQLRVGVSAFDPVFNSQDLHLLKEMGVSTLEVNDYGKRKVAHRTLFFMPRCPFELFNNVLWRNGSCLHDVVLFGNDLRSLETQMTSESLDRQFKYIKAVLPYIQTVSVTFNDSPLDTVMNNCVIHSFTGRDVICSEHDVGL